jgi:hypothetical protein
VLRTEQEQGTDDAFGRQVRKLLFEQGGVEALTEKCETVSAWHSDNDLPLLWPIHAQHRSLLFELIDLLDIRSASGTRPAPGHGGGEANCHIDSGQRRCRRLLHPAATRLSRPIFTGGALRGNLRLAESQHQQALIVYQQTIQRAFGDVSDALIGYQKLHQVRVRTENTVADLQESVRLSNMPYKGGTTTYLEVLDGQRSLYSAELTLAEARGNEYQKPGATLLSSGRRLAAVGASFAFSIDISSDLIQQ